MSELNNDTTNIGAGKAAPICGVEGYLTEGSLCAFLGGKEKPLGKSTINDWMKERGFPRPIRLSQTLKLWRVSEVVQWVEAQASANDDYLEEAK